ncbi:MAG: hypothetical protein SPE99_10460 [Blautia sp.]|nr:hypothetical protein [Blautia sp.]
MSQEQIAGIILCVIGLVLSAKPTLVWKVTENWKTENNSGPSDRYMTVLRIVGGAALGVGVLLLAGILK